MPALACGNCADFPCDNGGGHLRSDKACSIFKPYELKWELEDADSCPGAIIFQMHGGEIHCVVSSMSGGHQQPTVVAKVDEFLSSEIQNQISQMVFEVCKIQEPKFVRLSLMAAFDELQKQHWYPKKHKTETNNDKNITQTVQKAMSTPMQIAQALQDMVPISYDSAKNYWMWDHGLERYDRIDETEILCQIIEAINMDSVYQSKIKTEILESIRITGRRRRVETTPKEWIQFKDCVVNIDTREQFQATPNYFFAAPIPHNFGESEYTPTIDALFEAWVGPEKKPLLYEICAYCLYDGYPIHRIFCLVGVGRNGKGQFMELIRRFIGNNNCTSTDLERLSKSQFETSKLYKRKVAFIGETNFDTMSRTNVIKQLSGGDLVSCEFKGKDSTDFYNTAKMIISTNSLPATTDRTEGFYRRWLIIEFVNKFKEGKDIVNAIPEEEYENLCRKSIPILKGLLDNGSFTAEGTVEERAAEYERKSNPVSTFLSEYCVSAPEAFVPTWYLYEKYEAFQDRSGHRKINRDEFSKHLSRLGYELDQCWYHPDDQKKYGTNNDERKKWRTAYGISYIGNKECTSCTSCTTNINLNSHKKNRVEPAVQPVHGGTTQNMSDSTCVCIDCGCSEGIHQSVLLNKEVVYRCQSCWENYQSLTPVKRPETEVIL